MLPQFHVPHERKVTRGDGLLVSGIEIAVVQLHELLVSLVEVSDLVAHLRLEVPGLAVCSVRVLFKQLHFDSGLTQLIDPIRASLVDVRNHLWVARKLIKIRLVPAKDALKTSV